MRSDHTAILTTFKIIAIKFKVIEKIVTQTDWNQIGYHKMTNEIFNNILYISIYGITNYSYYNNYILQAGAATATINNQKNKGWFHFSRDFLLLLINTIYAIL